MADFYDGLTTFFMELIDIGPAYIRDGWKGCGGVGVWWVVEKAKKEKQHDTKRRAQSGYDIHMYPQRADVSLQGLYKRVLTVGAILGPHCQNGALHWCHFTSIGFTQTTKSTLEKQTS